MGEKRDGGVTPMYHFRFLYWTPMGMAFEDMAAESPDEAQRIFWEGHHRDTCQLIAFETLAVDHKGYERAEERGEQPLGGGGEDLGPEPSPAGEEAEGLGDVDDSRAPGGGEGYRVVLVGKGEKVKVLRLTEHRVLAYGDLRVGYLEPPLEVSKLAGMLSDLP